MRKSTALYSALTIIVVLPARGGGGRANLDGFLAGLDEKIATMANLVLSEHISRYSQVGSTVYQLDSFDTLVNVVDGAEEYSDVRRNNKSYSRLSQIDGVWSFGETVTLLRTTRDALNDRNLKPDRAEPGSGEGGEPEFELRYRYSADSHRWFVMVGSRTYWLDFKGCVRVSSRTGDIRRIAWTSSPLPPETGITRIEWTVEFQSVDIAGRLCTMPRTAVYRIGRNGGGNRADWNVTKFSEHGRYGSEAAFRLEP